MGPPMDHTGGLKLGSGTGVILAAQNEPKSKVSPMVYLHASLEIGSTVSHAIHWETEGDSHDFGSQRSPWHSAW